MKKIPLYRSGNVIKYARIDDELYIELSKYKWHLSTSGYAQMYRYNPAYHNNSECVFMHRMITKAVGRLNYVDHVNRNKLDNRKANLRIVSPAQNNLNTGMRRNNNSGFKGVSRCTGSEKWRARITIYGDEISLGHFDTKEQASVAYEKVVATLTNA